jgi:hypothetical protein
VNYQSQAARRCLEQDTNTQDKASMPPVGASTQISNENANITTHKINSTNKNKHNNKKNNKHTTTNTSVELPWFFCIAIFTVVVVVVAVVGVVLVVVAAACC